MVTIKLILIVASLLIIPLAYQQGFAQYSAGGVALDGSWDVGEGLEVGDYLSYIMCYVDY